MGTLRVILEIPQLLNATMLRDISLWIEQGDWLPGEASAGARAGRNKSNLEMNQRCPQWEKINKLVVGTLYQQPEFQRTVLPHRVSAAFVARYGEGNAYGCHVDDPIMGSHNARYRSDLACTIFLNDPGDYNGGELTVHAHYGHQSIKLAAGSAVVYPASSLHEVSAVNSGERIVCVLWIQSLVRGAHQREILAELSAARAALHSQLPEARVTQSIDLAYANLIRLWAEV